jgi:hypothetical protein
MAIDDHGKVYAWGLNERDIFTRGGGKIAPVEVLGLKGKRREADHKKLVQVDLM